MSFLPPSASFGVNSGTPGPGILTLINISAHSPFGGLTTASLGNGLAESRSYTPRGWLGSIGVGSIYTLNIPSSQMGYDGNGNVTSANDNINGNGPTHTMGPTACTQPQRQVKASLTRTTSSAI